MYYAHGLQEGDFGKPMIGVANGHSTITPCNSGLQKLADAAVEGLKAAGANAQVFGTPTISDGMAMGTEGMKYSLVSARSSPTASRPASAASGWTACSSSAAATRTCPAA
jgi:dihydroxyacid dehydratase/phosphogluconate dehydratase